MCHAACTGTHRSQQGFGVPILKAMQLQLAMVNTNWTIGQECAEAASKRQSRRIHTTQQPPAAAGTDTNQAADQQLASRAIDEAIHSVTAVLQDPERPEHCDLLDVTQVATDVVLAAVDSTAPATDGVLDNMLDEEEESEAEGDEPAFEGAGEDTVPEQPPLDLSRDLTEEAGEGYDEDAEVPDYSAPFSDMEDQHAGCGRPAPSSSSHPSGSQSEPVLDAKEMHPDAFRLIVDSVLSSSHPKTSAFLLSLEKDAAFWQQALSTALKQFPHATKYSFFGVDKDFADPANGHWLLQLDGCMLFKYCADAFVPQDTPFTRHGLSIAAPGLERFSQSPRHYMTVILHRGKYVHRLPTHRHSAVSATTYPTVQQSTTATLLTRHFRVQSHHTAFHNSAEPGPPLRIFGGVRYLQHINVMAQPL
jgi:hypothetical protein